MKNKPRKTVRGILQEWEIVPITDPGEQAALDRRCREARNSLSGLATPRSPSRTDESKSPAARLR